MLSIADTFVHYLVNYITGNRAGKLKREADISYCKITCDHVPDLTNVSIPDGYEVKQDGVIVEVFRK